VVSPTTKRDSANYIQYDGGLMVGSPAWLAGATFHGAGTIGTQHGVYDAGVLLSDHVFDRYFDGAPRPDEAQAVQGYAYVGLGQLRERLERDRHLPNMPSRTEWEAKDGASLGTVTTGLWETVEDQALYITQLEKTCILENTGTDIPQERISPGAGSKQLSEAQSLSALNEKAIRHERHRRLPATACRLACFWASPVPPVTEFNDHQYHGAAPPNLLDVSSTPRTFIRWLRAAQPGHPAPRAYRVRTGAANVRGL
jgi:hypothetical protein